MRHLAAHGICARCVQDPSRPPHLPQFSTPESCESSLLYTVQCAALHPQTFSTPSSRHQAVTECCGMSVSVRCAGPPQPARASHPHCQPANLRAAAASPANYPLPVQQIYLCSMYKQPRLRPATLGTARACLAPCPDTQPLSHPGPSSHRVCLMPAPAAVCTSCCFRCCSSSTALSRRHPS